MKASRINEFEAVVYQPANGGYVPHIKVKDISNRDWNFEKVQAEYPNELDVLRKFGINNNSRELYNTHIPREVDTLDAAELICNHYNSILTLIALQ